MPGKYLRKNHARRRTLDMMRRAISKSVVVLLYSAMCAAAPFAPLLPPADQFRLTLREDPHSHLPLGERCAREAAATLTCRAFVLTLQNLSPHTVHISELGCAGPLVGFEKKEPRSSTGWWPVSHLGRKNCLAPLVWRNIRLKPGAKTEFATRLSAGEEVETFAPGTYTLLARWTLYGCIEQPEGTDCLDALQDTRHPGDAPRVSIQEPVTVVSNEIQAEAPKLPDLGPVKLAISVAIAPEDSTTETLRHNAPGCATEQPNSVACVVFRADIRNLGTRAVQWFTLTCSDSDIVPEYRADNGPWQRVPTVDWTCTSNVMFPTPILPGKAVQRTFTLRSLAPGYDVSKLVAVPDYVFRFTLIANTCIAAPDGSFCLSEAIPAPAVTSNEVAVRGQ